MIPIQTGSAAVSSKPRSCVCKPHEKINKRRTSNTTGCSLLERMEGSFISNGGGALPGLAD